MKKIFIIIILSFPCGAMAQQLQNLEQFTTDDGLSQNLVFDMEQDYHGFIWIGTKDGLNRYDGYNFRIYRNDPSRSNTLSSNYITYINEDQDRNLWVETLPGGLHLYNRRSDDFTRISNRSDVPKAFAEVSINSMYGNNNKGWWIGTNRGLYHLSPDLEQVKVVPIPGADPDNRIFAMEKTLSGEYLVLSVSGEGLFKLEINSGEIVPHDALNRHAEGRSIRHIFQPSPEEYLLVDGSSVYRVDVDGELLRTDSLDRPGYVRLEVFEQLADGTFIGISDRTLYKYEPSSGQFSILRDSSYLNSFLEDRSGVFWLGSSGYGLYKYDPKTARFGHTQNIFFDTLVPGFSEAKRNLTDASKTRFMRQIFGILPISDNRYYVLTRATGLYDYNTQTGDIHRFKTELFPEGLGSETLSFDQDEEGNLYVFSYSGISVFHPDEGLKSFIPMMDLFPDFTRVSSLPIFEKITFVKKLNQILWAGTIEFGLVSRHLETGEIKHYRYDSNDQETMSSNHPLHLSPDPLEPDQYVWVGTDGGGLNRIDLETGSVMRYTESEGLPNNVVYALYPDKNGYLWMSTNKGINRLDVRNMESLNFSKSDGLQSDEFNRREHMRLPDGRIIFCGVFGCNTFNPDEILLNETEPVIAITDVSVKNESVLPLSSEWFNNSENDNEFTLNVDWGQNIIGFEFASLEYSAPDKNRYMYRMPPFLNEWTEIGNQRNVTFTNLDPGRYTLEIIGSNNDGLWSSTPAVMSVVVHPPFWMTVWFRALVICSAIGLIVWLVWYLSKRKYRMELQRLQYKMAVDEERLRISRDMHDDLGSRLTQIKLMSQFAESDQSVPEKLKEKFVEISDEAEEVIHNFSEIVWALNPKNDTLYNLSGFLVQYAENFCRKVNIPCRIHADTQFPKTPVKSDVRHNLISVFKESLNNAAKHSSCAELHVELALKDDHFIIEIRDNGVGFDPGKMPLNGQGLRSMKSRVENIGGIFNIESAPDRGTIVGIRWPVIST